MITIDGIVFSLQGNGGVSVCFRELISRLSRLTLPVDLVVLDEHAAQRAGGGRLVATPIPYQVERYRRSNVSEETVLFHSSYYRLPKSSKVPAITTVHDFTYERFSCGPRRWIHSWQKFSAIRESAAVICVSENTRSDLLTWVPEVDPKRVHVVHNGVGDSFRPIEVERLGPDEGDYVLFVGARGGYKNFSIAVDAIAASGRGALVCVGGGPFSTGEKSLLDKNLPGRYRHAGAVSDDALNRLYNGARCLLYPSSYEGFGIPVVEAMRAGCPVVAVNASSIPEVAGDAAYLVEWAAPDLIKAAIEAMENPNIRSEYRKKGLEQAEKFSWDRTFEGTVRVYESVLGSPLLRPLS